MDITTVSRIHSSVVAAARLRTSIVVQTATTAGGKPSAVGLKAQKLGVHLSSLNGTSVTEAVGIISSSRRVSRNAERRKNRSNSNVRSEQIDVTATSVKTIERSLLPDRSVDQEIVTLKGKLSLSRTVGEKEPPSSSFAEFQKNVWFTLVSSELDEQGVVKTSARTQMQEDGKDNDVFYDISFSVPSDFGEPGALLVESKNKAEFYLQFLDLSSSDLSTKYEFLCNSWITPRTDESSKIAAFRDDYREFFPENLCLEQFQHRIFFTNKVYLPKYTPAGLKQLRLLDMWAQRGDGTGERKASDRIYDYDVYNDLGIPEGTKPIVRPTLGGPGNLPYPRRCRTGRKIDAATGMETLPAVDPKDPLRRRFKIYVPRDEDFSKTKDQGFQTDSLHGFLQSLLPKLKAKFDASPDDFDTLLEIFDLYEDGVNLFPEFLSSQPTADEKKALTDLLNNYVFSKVPGVSDEDLKHIKYDTPQIIKDDPKAWITDEEFGRQTLAGLNPMVIARAKVFPPKSDLPVDVFGPGTALTPEDIEPYLHSKGKRLTVAEAIAHKRLFTIDYHDVFLPYVQRINSQTDTKRFIYAPRAFFFLTDDKKMKPVAIELSLPPPQKGEDKPLNRVFTPPKRDNNYDFEWELAKVHFSSVDLGYHELVSHWLKCHAVMEPFIIATRRQLSAMHPIFVLLDPCFVNTMRINANARASLIAAAPTGTIESYFTPGQYGNVLSAVAYDKLWRFDKVGLPEDLLARGMAERDFSKPEGVKLLLEDYPYAKDGLDVWKATKVYITDYVNLFYKSDETVREDEELQAWWREIREVGHEDKKDADWWPSCKSVDSLIDILCTVFWIAGPQHAAVNFGQYAYAAFMPNHCPMTRRPIPEPNTPEHKEMLFNFERYMLRVASSPVQTVSIMTTLAVLSSHSQDEEYIGHRLDENWTSDPQVKQVFRKYADQIRRLEIMFEQRNKATKSDNRHGALKTPGYTLMYPTSGPGVTGRGIPWSISI